MVGLRELQREHLLSVIILQLLGFIRIVGLMVDQSFSSFSRLLLSAILFWTVRVEMCASISSPANGADVS